VESEETETSGALIPNEKRPGPVITSTTSTITTASKPRQKHEERVALEARLKDHVLSAWDRLESLRPGMENGDKGDMDQWVAIAKELIDEFRSIKSFFPYEKGKRITWYDEDQPATPGRKRKGTDFEARVEEIESRLQDNAGSTLVRMCADDRI
jgi:hypothetical protein